MSDSTTTDPIEILLVEDNPGDVRLVQEAFRDAAFDVTLHTVTNGDDALAFLDEHWQNDSGPDPDLVLLDLNLPRTDGFAVLEELRDSSEPPLLPVIVLTSSKDRDDIAKSYELCANAYLTKPNSPDEFVSMVEAVEEFWFDAARLPPIPS